MPVQCIAMGTVIFVKTLYKRPCCDVRNTTLYIQRIYYNVPNIYSKFLYDKESSIFFLEECMKYLYVYYKVWIFDCLVWDFLWAVVNGLLRTVSRCTWPVSSVPKVFHIWWKPWKVTLVRLLAFSPSDPLSSSILTWTSLLTSTSPEKNLDIWIKVVSIITNLSVRCEQRRREVVSWHLPGGGWHWPPPHN